MLYFMIPCNRLLLQMITRGVCCFDNFMKIKYFIRKNILKYFLVIKLVLKKYQLLLGFMSFIYIYKIIVIFMYHISIRNYLIQGQHLYCLYIFNCSKIIFITYKCRNYTTCNIIAIFPRNIGKLYCKILSLRYTIINMYVLF